MLSPILPWRLVMSLSSSACIPKRVLALTANLQSRATAATSAASTAVPASASELATHGCIREKTLFMKARENHGPTLLSFIDRCFRRGTPKEISWDHGCGGRQKFNAVVRIDAPLRTDQL